MARFTQQPFEFYSDPSANLDSKPTFPEEDEMSSVLDEKILDSNSDANGMSDLRRLSYDHHVDALAYREQNPFGDFAMNQPHLQSHPHHQSQMATAVQTDATRQPSNLQSSMPLYDSNGQFMRLDTAHANAIYAQQSAWQMSRGSGSCTPTPVYDQYAQDYDASSAGAFSGGAVGPVSAINFGQMSSYRSNVFGAAAPGSVAMSPQSSQGWVQPGDIVDGRTAQSPSFRPDSNMHMRRDGIRKKNARFEIPPERTLSNIDQLIAQSSNEEEIKELKQQKRLLRNRQAALDSRQRKKMHTEKLEEEKKHFTTAISDLEEALHSQQMLEKELRQENTTLSTNIQHYQQYVENLRMEKDELIRIHTLETAELRKKNNILRETMEKMEQQFKSMGNTHTSHAFGTTNGFVHHEYDNMHMETGQWDEMSLVNNISLEAEGLNAPVDGGNVNINTNGHDSMTALVPAKNDKVEKIFNNQNSDYPFSWNAFYMCLLFGAFIASNSSSLSSQAALPQLSDEYRAESANVLKAVLASAPGDATSAALQHGHSSSSFGRQPFPSNMAAGAEMAHASGSAASTSTLDNLHNNLALPTKQQENDQVFALNADQYNALTTFHDTDGHNSMDMGDKPAQPQPSNLQQALAAMRGHGNEARTSQVYSRSLMWDRVPEKVVRDFQRMVRECGSK